MKRLRSIGKKRTFTLVELMVVIVIIGLIGSVVAYNVRGSLEKGKIFKTTEALRQLDEVLALELAGGEKTIEQFAAEPRQFLSGVELVKRPGDLLKDGWGREFVIELQEQVLTVTSHQGRKQLRIDLGSSGGGEITELAADEKSKIDRRVAKLSDGTRIVFSIQGGEFRATVTRRGGSETILGPASVFIVDAEGEKQPVSLLGGDQVQEFLDSVHPKGEGIQLSEREGRVERLLIRFD